MEEYTWAIIYVPALIPGNTPFFKIPIEPNTTVEAVAKDGLNERTRFDLHSEVMGKVSVDFRMFMTLSEHFFAQLDDIVAIINAYFAYARSTIDPDMLPGTAYALCMSVFPPRTFKDSSIHALLTLEEVKTLTKSSSPIEDIYPIRLDPHRPMDPVVVR